MEIKRYEWFKDIIEALKAAKIEFDDITLSDYSDYFKVTIKMKDGNKKRKD